MDLQTWIWYKRYIDTVSSKRRKNEMRGARWLSIAFIVCMLIILGSCGYMAWSLL